MIGALRHRWLAPGANLADQALNSIASLLLTVSLARSYDAAEFGVYAILQLALFSLATLHRVLLGTWILTDSASDADDQKSVSLFLASLFGLCSLVVFGIMYWASSAPEFLVGLLLQPFVYCVYDHGRVMAIRRSHNGRLVMYGTLSLLGASTGFVTGLLVGGAEAQLATLGYVAGMALSGVIHVFHIRTLKFSMEQLGAYVRAKSVDFRSQLIVAAGLILPTAAAPSLVGVAAGATAVAAVRGAQTLVSVPLQIPQGLRSLFLARYSDEVLSKGDVSTRSRRLYLASQVLPIMAFASIVAVTPSPVGEAVLGDSWEIVDDVIFFFLLASVFAQLTAGIDIYARARGVLKKVSLGLALGTVGVVAGIGIGAYLGGAYGAGIASASCQFVRFMVCKFLINR